MSKANRPTRTDDVVIRNENILIFVACFLFFTVGFFVIITGGGDIYDVFGVIALTIILTAAIILFAIRLEKKAYPKHQDNSNQNEV